MREIYGFGSFMRENRSAAIEDGRLENRVPYNMSASVLDQSCSPFLALKGNTPKEIAHKVNSSLVYLCVTTTCSFGFTASVYNPVLHFVQSLFILFILGGDSNHVAE